MVMDIKCIGVKHFQCRLQCRTPTRYSEGDKLATKKLVTLIYT